jgi:LysW-gamma-L-lysine carboxypeptidase
MGKGTQRMNQTAAVALLHQLVAIPSLSMNEAAACRWLAAEMARLGFERAFVDKVGNAVGELGATDAARTLVLLGHIDTVPGAIPVRIEGTPDGDVLYGRGSVDAKGPLATFVCAGARIGAAWCRANGLRIIVVGAVEEEAASSKGARFIRDRFDGVHEPIPTACIIGEPSGWQRVTLGYKGRLLIELDASQPMAHTAGPDAGVAVTAVELWRWIETHAAAFNGGRDRAFDQLQPSLRRLHTFTDEQMHDHVQAQIGLRLPLDFSVAHFVDALAGWANEMVATPTAQLPQSLPTTETPATHTFVGEHMQVQLHYHAQERAWRSDRNNALVRSFLAGIRAVDEGARPTFVVKTGTSDMNVVAPAWGCPIVAYGPGDSSLDHTPHEHLSLDEYWRSVLALESTIANFADFSA